MSAKPAEKTDGDGPSMLGAVVVCALALISSALVLAMPAAKPAGLTMWTAADPHRKLYEPEIKTWPEAERPRISLLSFPALEQRMLAGFLTSTPTADLIEAERRIAARAFLGPLEGVGFIDLTDRLKAEGLYDQINQPSFGPWTSRGRVFGLPHDVHPVMLGYRSDIVEAAGIDVSQIETWDDFIRILSPIMAEKDADGRPKHYLLNLWDDKEDLVEVLMLQAGGGLFDDRGRPRIATDINARTIATIVRWCRGPDRIAADAPDFSSGGNRLKAEGYVLAAIMPDWMCNIWKLEIPQLKGKMKVMPLPAWERGGRRTSIWGGTMLGIPKTAADPDRSWAVAKRLYFSPELSRQLYKVGDIITPVRSFWTDPVFDEPDRYFSNQRKGRMYIDLAPTVPIRNSSPYNHFAKLRVQAAVLALSDFAQRGNDFRPEVLEPEAMRLLKIAEAQVAEQVDRNRFLSDELSPPAASTGVAP
ncbi:MAG: extracellular solute-binding protein [Phycisphaerales bacterium]|nr:extracellular solute-binding protein [Phycisphaerales bacterium]